MDQKVLKIDDLNPDELRVTVNWEGMSVGASIFVPCVNTEKCREQLITRQTQRMGVDTQTCIENGKLGLRTWRTV